MFKWISSLLLVVASSSFAAEFKTDNPYTLVKQVADKTFTRVKNDQAKIAQDKAHFKVIVEEELMPYIDYKYASFRVLSSYIQDVRELKTDAEKEQAKAHIRQFMAVFREYLITTYAGVFTQYKDQLVEFGQEQPFDNEKIVVVKTTIKDPNRPDISIAFKVRRDNNNEWRAYDMIAEGISLLDAKQSELQGIIRSEGIEYVIDLLDRKSKLPVQFRGKGE